MKIKKFIPYILNISISAILSAILTIFVWNKFFYEVSIYYEAVYFLFITAFIILLTQQLSPKILHFLSLIKDRVRNRNAEFIFNNLEDSGIFILPLQEVSKIWTEDNDKEKENVVELDMSKMYYIWRDTYAIEKHKNKGKEYKNEEIKEFFQKIHGLFHKRLENKKETPEYMSFQAEYRVIIFLLDFLDQNGHCASVVQKGNKGEFRSNEPDSYKSSSKVNAKKDENKMTDYEILKCVTLTQHSLHVANIIIELITKKEKEIYQSFMLPSAIIAALAHDIGKAPDFYDSSRYTMMLHPSISAEILGEFINGPIREAILKEKIEIIDFAIKKHHASTVNRTKTDEKMLSLYDYLVGADRQARENEIEMVSRKMGIYMMNEKEKETTEKNENKGEDIKGDLEEVKNSMQLNDFQSEFKKNKAKQQPKNQSHNSNNDSNNEKRQISFKYPDFDELLTIKPADYNYNVPFEKEDYTINWLTEEVLHSMLEIIEERINYVNDKNIYNVFNVKDTLFVTTNVITSLLHYFGQDHGESVLDMQKDKRTQLAITLVKNFEDIDVIATNQKKENYMGGWFNITFSDYKGKNTKEAKAYYTPFNLDKIADIFHKNAEDYEFRKRDKRYDSIGILKTIRSFKWGSTKKV